MTSSPQADLHDLNPPDPQATHTPAAPDHTPTHDARLGDRGAASGRNIAQNRAIGQDDPTEGSRMGRGAEKGVDAPGGPDIGTDAAQLEEARRAGRSDLPPRRQ